MRNVYDISRELRILSFFIISLLFLSSPELYGQKGNGKDSNDIYIVLSCTEYIGDGKVVAHFGYENKGKKTVVIDEAGSVVTYNHGQAKKYGLYTFEPGVKEKAFSQEFDSKDRVEWTVVFSDGTEKSVDANINSNHCRGVVESLAIIPGYEPPEGGKEYNSKIGAELTSLYNAYSLDPAGFAGATDDIFQLDGAMVLIEVVSNSGQYDAMIASLNLLGFDLVTADPGLYRATGWVEIADLLLLNDMAALYYARPVYPGVSNYTVPATGLTKSQGDFAMHSDFARLGFDIDGSGVKIGVLSNSYDTQGNAHIDVGNGDLPGPGNPNGDSLEVDVLLDIVPTHGALSDEGRAMLQIVHDIAPGAELAFRTGYLGEQDMADGIRELAGAGTDVIVDDLSYITEPFFRDGVISQAIDEVVADGVTFFSSAGNFGRASYMGVFDSEPAPSTITGTAHDFNGSGDIFQGVMLGEGDYTLVLQWDDGSDPTMNTTTTDLDIFLSDDVAFSLLGFNRENVGGFPIEVVPFSVVGDSVEANVVVARASGPANVDVTFKYILFRGGSQFKMLEYGDGGSSTIVGHPNAAGAISVGAVRFDKNPVYNPSEYPVPVIMSFSSIGGTPVDGVVRSKPDITAPNGVNTTVDLGNGDWPDSVIDPDTLYPNFFGTSAASPHAAGVAALIIEAKSKYDSDNQVMPETIRALLKGTAIDMDDPEEDRISGAGFIQAHKALMTFANPSPYVENLILAAEGGVPGVEITPFSFTITGDFFTDSTLVLFRGDTLESGVVVVDESTIAVDHEGFIGNPEVQVYNPPISSNEEDGGFSEGIYFSDPVKQKIVITANNVSKKYGETLPEFTANYLLITVDDDSLTFESAISAGVMLQEEADRLSLLTYTAPASDTSDAGQYIVVPAVNPALDLENPQSEIDYAISEKYILEFVNGNLAIEKLALKITPRDVGMIYGEALPSEGIQFLYEIGDSTVVIDNPDSLLIGVKLEHTAALTNEIALVRGVALVNGIPMIRGIALVNGVRMVRGIALVNGVEVKVEVEGADTTVYVAGEPIANGRNLIRGIALVNGLPFVSMTEIVRGIALVNGDEVTFEDGYMTELDGVPLENKVPAVRGIALVNGIGSLGIALVNGHTVVVENGITTVDGGSVPTNGISLVNGIPVVRGVALVNSSFISRGVALVNGLEVPIENGIPSVRGIALVNGIPLSRGTALVNNLEVNVIDGEVGQVYKDGALVNGLNMSRGIAMVNGIALVNGTQLSRGVALVNGIALVNEAGSGDDVVNLENMNFLASGTALVNGTFPSVRGIALVNGMEGLDGQSLKIAAGTEQEDGTIVYENAVPTRGLALVNGLAYVRGIALVNGSPLSSRGIALVNGSTINETSNSGTIMVFDATTIGDTTENTSFKPISFITGTTAGQHWIVPGTFVSNNFEISYGLGTLTIEPADLNITALDKTKTYGEADPVLTYSESGLFPEDTISGELNREEGEDAGDHAILQGSLTAGDNYAVHYDSAVLTINPASLMVVADAESKPYDGTRVAEVSLSDNRLSEDTVDITYTSALFEDKNVDSGKEVTVLGIALEGSDAGNYTANVTATDTASIFPIALDIGISADDKPYDGTTSAVTYASVVGGLLPEDVVTVSLTRGLFSTDNAGNGILVTADVAASGVDAGNYTVNVTAADTASIFRIGLEIGISADDKPYDGTTSASTSAHVVGGLLPEDLVTLSSTGGLFSTENAGNGILVTADVTASGDDSGNYTANVAATDTASIFRIGLEIGISADDKLYNGTTSASTSAYLISGVLNSDDVTVSSTGGFFSTKYAATGKLVTANVLSSGVDAGNYSANATATDTASIFRIGLEIGISADDKPYDGTTSASTAAYVTSGLVGSDNVVVSSSGGMFVSKDAGTGIDVTANVSSSGSDAGNYTANTTASAIADITQREVSVTVADPFLYIREGDPLPTLAFNYLGWIPGDTGNEGYTVLRDTDGASYSASSNNSAGSYTVTPVPTNTNYIFAVETGVLHVNPYGPGTRAVKPVLNCIEEIAPNYYVANFEYMNDNDAAIYIPMGPDNLLTGSGIDLENSDVVPTMFVPGGGSFRVFFDGSELAWTVNSRNGNQKVSNAANANSGSTKCNGNTKSATVSADIDEGIPGTDELVAYPNPVITKVHLNMKAIENYKMIQLYDFSGRSFPITSIDKRTNNLEIDMEQLAAGNYFIRVVMEDSSRVVQIIKH